MPEQVTGYLDPDVAAALAGVLDSTRGPIEVGDALPPLWHWVYLLNRPANGRLQPDGHLSGGVLDPPAEGMRRMIAGGRVTLLAPLLLGAPATRVSEVVDRYTRPGRTGPLEFASMRHRITQGGILAVEEYQTVVYRQAAGSSARDEPSRSPAPSPAASVLPAREISVSPTRLFQFSALTYNAHRIHYDQPYTVDVEGYSGLIVHGPLQALLMSELACERAGAWTTFAFRLVAPHIAGSTLGVTAEVEGTAVRTSIVDAGGNTTAVGSTAVGTT